MTESRRSPGAAEVIALVAVIGVAGFAYADLFRELLDAWNKPDYSYAYFVPLLMGWIFWTDRRAVLGAARVGDGAVACGENGTAARAGGGVLGGDRTLACLLLVLTAVLYVLGNGSAIRFLSFLSLWTLLLACIGLYLGDRVFRPLWAFSLVGLFMIPLPAFVFRTASFQLRLISSWMAENMLSLIAVPVYRDGNLIDLGTIQLEVIDACSGLRYLLPSLLMAVVAGWMLLRRPLYRAVLVVLAVPVAVVVNAFRLTVTGVLCKYIGPEMAEGFFHDASGWLVYLLALASLFGILLVLRRLERGKAVRAPESGGTDAAPESGGTDVAPDSGGTARAPEPGREKAGAVLSSLRPLGAGALGVLFVSLAVLVAAHMWNDRPALVPRRETLAHFPVRIGDWSGTVRHLSAGVMDDLGATDAFYAVYTDPQGKAAVHVLISYYERQNSLAAAHAPTSCLLGSGWSIERKEEREPGPGHPYPVGRMILRRTPNRMLSNYWFQQRGRVISNELANKWYLAVDALTSRRTDGGLIRLELLEHSGLSLEDGQRLLDAFAADMRPQLERFIPGI